MTDTLFIAEGARRALMSIYGRMAQHHSVRGRSHVFSGKDEEGNPLTDHGHAYYLPTDEDGDGRLDHLTIVARNGFGPHERRALDQLQELRMGNRSEERHPLKVLLLGMGTIDEYHPGPLCPSEVWVSATPYLVTRHPKTRGKNRIDLCSPAARAAYIQSDLRSQISAVRPDVGPEIARVRIEPIFEGAAFRIAGRWRPAEFRRSRAKAADDGGRRLAGAFRIKFPRPVDGPVALGHSSHFGMGLFVPEQVRGSQGGGDSC